MKQGNRVRALLARIQTFPLYLLNLSMAKRLLVVLFSHILGVAGLWFFFPVLHNAASMLLPLVCLCWLFSYRGLLLSLFSTGAAMFLAYHFFLDDTFIGRALLERAISGFGVSFLLSLSICWLRAAIDLAHQARQQALTAEQERLLALEKERQATIGYEQQRKINELKDQFLLNVSHELRTPLAVLGGSLEMLKEYFEALDAEKRELVLAQALASQETLVEFVNRVLDTAEVGSETPLAQPQVVDMHRLLLEVLAHLAPEDVQAYTIRLQMPEQVMIWADPQFLRQIVLNLLSNIFKYVPKQTEICIEATQVSPAYPVCLSVQDAGPGIPSEELPLLFEKFVRLRRDLAGTKRGTGLGLYISKQLVKAMNGEIWVESSGRSGEGSRFCLTLPPFSSS